MNSLVSVLDYLRITVLMYMKPAGRPTWARWSSPGPARSGGPHRRRGPGHRHLPGQPLQPGHERGEDLPGLVRDHQIEAKKAGPLALLFFGEVTQAREAAKAAPVILDTGMSYTRFTVKCNKSNICSVCHRQTLPFGGPVNPPGSPYFKGGLKQQGRMVPPFFKGGLGGI